MYMYSQKGSDSSMVSALTVSAEGPGSNLGSAGHQMPLQWPPSSKMGTWLLLGSEGGEETDWSVVQPCISVALTLRPSVLRRTIDRTLLYFNVTSFGLSDWFR